MSEDISLLSALYIVVCVCNLKFDILHNQTQHSFTWWLSLFVIMLTQHFLILKLSIPLSPCFLFYYMTMFIFYFSRDHNSSGMYVSAGMLLYRILIFIFSPYLTNYLISFYFSLFLLF